MTIIPLGYGHCLSTHVITNDRTLQYEQTYEQTAPYMSDPGPSNTTETEPVPATEPPISAPMDPDKTRGRKRAKTQVMAVLLKVCF